MLLLAGSLPSLVILPARIHALHGGTPPTPMFSIGITVVSMVLGMLLIPLYAGYLGVIDAVERGQPARAVDIFRPYRNESAPRLIGFGLAVLLVYVAIVIVILVAQGGGIFHWYIQLITAQTQPLAPPSLPHGFGVFIGLIVVFGLFFSGFYAISLGQVSLGGRGVFASIGDGIVGAIKNVLPLLVFVLGLVVVWVAFVVAVMLVLMVTVLLGKLVGEWLVFVVSIPVGIAMMLAMFVGMFGVMYHLWRDVCGTDDAAAVPEPVTA